MISNAHTCIRTKIMVTINKSINKLLNVHRIIQSLKLIITLFLIFFSKNVLSQNDHQPSSFVNANTMSEVNAILQDVAFEVVLQAEKINLSSSELIKANYLIPLATFIDLNVIGKGKSVVIDKSKMSRFVIKFLEQGKSLQQLSASLVNAFANGEFRPDITPQKSSFSRPNQSQIKSRIGAFVATEFEYHQEPDGKYVPLMEINQVRIFFNTHFSSSANQNNIDFLAEWNPVPEEVIHQIEEVSLQSVGIDDTLRGLNGIYASSQAEDHPEDIIGFEQLYLKILNVQNSGIDITIGQFRNPFGIWSDYTSHRNFTSTKNNVLVNDFALKKIELGLLVEKEWSNGFNLALAIVHGRLGRTVDLLRADIDNAKDFVSRIGFNTGALKIGMSTYLSEFSINKKAAWGLDWLFSIPRLSVSGEVVVQRNKHKNVWMKNGKNTNITLSSLGAYTQFHYLLTDRLSFYGLYETWRIYANDQIIDQPTYKIFHGIKFQLNQYTRWTILEFGRMIHKNIDQGYVHLSTQFEFVY